MFFGRCFSKMYDLELKRKKNQQNLFGLGRDAKFVLFSESLVLLSFFLFCVLLSQHRGLFFYFVSVSNPMKIYELFLLSDTSFTKTRHQSSDIKFEK